MLRNQARRVGVILVLVPSAKRKRVWGDGRDTSDHSAPDSLVCSSRMNAINPARSAWSSTARVLLGTLRAVFVRLDFVSMLANLRCSANRKLVIIGDGACGKTSLLSVFTLGYFPTVSASLPSSFVLIRG